MPALVLALFFGLTVQTGCAATRRPAAAHEVLQDVPVPVGATERILPATKSHGRRTQRAIVMIAHPLLQDPADWYRFNLERNGWTIVSVSGAYNPPHSHPKFATTTIDARSGNARLNVQIFDQPNIIIVADKTF